MSNLERLLMNNGLPDNVLAIALICSFLGTAFLSRHTLQLGILGYLINFLVLLAGAITANVLMKNVRLPLDYYIERPLVITLGGMLAASIILLLVLSRDRDLR